MINVYIIGARGYEKKYGGWETLVHGLVDNQINNEIKYHVFEIVDDKNSTKSFEIDGIECIRIFEKARGGFQMIFADLKAFKYVLNQVSKNIVEKPVVLYLGARIGPMLWTKRRLFQKKGIKILENPAGLEWKRPKWGPIGSLYQYISCYFTAISSDYIVCDCVAMKDVYDKMLKSEKHPRLFIPYGSYPQSELTNFDLKKVSEYYKKYSIKPNDYYLIINRFMPENSWELILKEFMKSKTNKDFIIVSNIDKESKYYNKLKNKLHFENDKRIKFVGTTYDKDILYHLRKDAFAYFNGHTVGGTNPGLSEAMSSTGFVLARDCVFSREVCGECALFFDESEDNSLSKLRIKSEEMNREDIETMKNNAKKRMRDKYNWNNVASDYEQAFMVATKR